MSRPLPATRPDETVRLERAERDNESNAKFRTGTGLVLAGAGFAGLMGCATIVGAAPLMSLFLMISGVAFVSGLVLFGVGLGDRWHLARIRKAKDELANRQASAGISRISLGEVKP